ncbi:bifunctional riboflavin kinase/FAD synthetase [Arsenicicoccus sp. oral taxon 190]|uniref:bifunctional riboflavin kinase/FAD synthetase n=1 Tax=Arsenicicoccus sp. oral taxon 190 TaxID=1658671 RepID=UPI00067A3877|nr:bifunctional riboflavin kinase/FAD synthetase [Arsenicicoccus sp. oral taxon 190]AKT51566.1 riboflavin kinase [Arsenicicoccus sp. oral taxon 190]
MHRWNALSQIPPDLGPTVVTLGNFDGVHRGHKAVLQRVLELAADRRATTVAVTFDPHPVAVLHPERAPVPVTSLEHRLDLIEQVGIDAVLVQEFTHELAQMSPEDYVQAVFVDALHACAVVVGEDTRFGHKNSGDAATLRALGEQHGFEVVTLSDIGDGQRWSSSMVRQRVLDGDVAGAAAVLGRPHRVVGRVVHGDHRGRELGYPTANLSQDAYGLVPEDGVYAGWLLRLDLDTETVDRLLPAAISVGTNPTFEGTQRRVEAYVLDRTDLDLYGEQVAVEFVERLRPTLRFSSVDELLAVMADDVARCREVLSSFVPS